MEHEPQQTPIKTRPFEKSPYAGIFFETDVLLEKAKAGCIERLRPLVTRPLQGNELFASIQVNESQDFGINYNTFSKPNENEPKEIIANYAMYGEETVIPGLQEHIENYLRGLEGKKVSQTAEYAFIKSLEKRLLAFFSSCWKEAGGLDALTPTYFSFEDDSKFIDMGTGASLTQKQIVKNIGQLSKAKK